MQQFESFAQMQRDAAMRVMEMQRRAQAAMQQDAGLTGVSLPAGFPDRSPLEEPERFPDSPDNAPAFPQKRGTGEPGGQEADHPGALAPSDDESERALITAILLLLMREKADERLIFALLYILI